MIKVVNMGEAMAIHSRPLITFSDMTKMPHQTMTSPK